MRLSRILLWHLDVEQAVADDEDGESYYELYADDDPMPDDTWDEEADLDALPL